MSSTTLKGWLERQSKKPVSIKLTISAPQVSPKIHFSCGSALLIPCVARAIAISISVSSVLTLALTRCESFCSSLSVKAAISAVWLSNLSCSRSAKLRVIVPVLLVDAAPEPQALVGVGIAHRHVVLACPRDLQPGLGQRIDQADTVMHRPPLDQGRHVAVDGLLALFQVESVLRPRRRQLEGHFPRPRRIIRARPAMLQVQCVPQGGKAPLPAGRRDVERPPGGQLHARGHEVQLHPPTLGVLVPHPGDVELIDIEAGEGKGFEGVHRGLLLDHSGRILGREGQHSVRVGPLPPDAVDQLLRPRQVAPHHLRRAMLPALAFRIDQVAAHRSPAAPTAAGKFDEH